MEKIMLVRLKPHDPKKGLLLKQYTYQGIRFLAGRGWYKVNGQVAAYLENVHSIPGDEGAPLAFDVCTPDEARAMDENDRKAARQVLPAEEALDASHVSDEQPRVKSRPGPARDDVPRRPRHHMDRLPENAWHNALGDDDMENEAPHRRPSRRRASVVSRRPHAAAHEDFAELDDDEFNGGDESSEDEAPRQTRRGRPGAVPSRRLRAGDEALDDEELDHAEGFPAEPPARRPVTARSPLHRREYDSDDNAPVRRGQRRPHLVEELDEREALDDELLDEFEGAPPPPCCPSFPPRSRASQARHTRRYAVEHAALDDDDRQSRHVRGPRQAEAFDALRNRETRRTRQYILEDQYEEMPARCVPEDAVGSELDDESTHTLSRSRSQGRYQDELHIRHARQMAAKLKEIDARDNTMSYGDAEDSLPNEARRNRHDGQGDAEDSLPARKRQQPGGC